MPKLTPISLLFSCICAASFLAVDPASAAVEKKPNVLNSASDDSSAGESFAFQDANGSRVSVPLVDDSAKRKIAPKALAKIDPKMNPAMVRAATIAQERAHAHSKSRCWRYVKQALLAAGVVDSYPKTALAKQAANELVQDYGFKKLPVNNPYAAPVGAVLVYGGKGAGHIEIRNKTGFVSDFRASTPSKRKLIGVYAKA